MKIGTSNEKLLQESYKRLNNMCEDSEGIGIDTLFVDSNDPKTKEIHKGIKQIRVEYKRYLAACSSSSSARVRRFMGRSGISDEAKQLMRTIERILDLLTTTTQQRGDHKLLAPLAFRSNLSSIPELTTASSFVGTWVVDFNEEDASSSGISFDSRHANGTDTISVAIASLLKEFGLTYHALTKWWRDHHLDKHTRETIVWNDMRAMARKVVFMLDYCVDVANMVEPDFDAFCECVAEGQRTAISIIRLIDLYPNKMEKIRPCVELFVPVLFVLSECTEGLRCRRSEVLDVLTPVVHHLKSIVDYLGGKLLANQQLDALEHDATLSEDVLAGHPISQHGRSELLASGLIQDPSQLDETLKRTDDDISKRAREVVAKKRAHPIHSIQDMKRLGLDKIELEGKSCGFLGRGSFGLIRKYNSQDLIRQYAVKIFTRSDKNYNEERIWNHIIREAEIWRFADHRNINKLIGFCTFSDSVYPGLVMDVCEENLSEYCSIHSLSVEDRLNLMLDVASGLNYLHVHERRYAHGDLRPENILIKCPSSALRPFAVITDFGVADMTEIVLNRISISTDGQKAPEVYLAPEFCMDLSDGTAKVSTEADMYAFGCVFAVVVCEAVLYEKAQNRVRRLKERGEFPVASENVSDKKYWRLLCNLWDKNPKKRLTASGVLGTLRKFIIAIRSSPVCG